MRYRLFVATIYEIRFYYLYFKYKCNNVCDPSLTECYNIVGTCVRLIVMHLVSVANVHNDGFYSVQTTIILPSACFVIGVHSYPIYISPRHDHIVVTLIHNWRGRQKKYVVFVWQLACTRNLILLMVIIDTEVLR